MEKYNLTLVEKVLEGKISKNSSRFECANGVVFQVAEMNEEIESYFICRGIEVYQLEKNVYYTETVMSLGEFSNLDHILKYKAVA